ncbi:MAG: esterase-like activity of phytase family protein [Paracoccaceae bacterium]
MLSDHGFITSARLRRGYGQQEHTVQVLRVDPLQDENGHLLHGSMQDAEGIALGRDGTIYVSFEQHNRVLAYPRLGGPAIGLGEHVDFERMRAGRAMEALAVARDGSVYAIPERPARATYGFPSYRLRDGDWTGSFRLPSEGTFLPVGADFGPDNQLYVLERTIENGRFRSLVRRFAINGRAISEPQVVMRSDPGQFDNLEGLAVFRDWNGRIHLLMVSDDDMNANLRSEIVDVVLNR